jgi:hypothetical protein
MDFSSIVIAFTDKEFIIKKYNITIKKLLVFKPLSLTPLRRNKNVARARTTKNQNVSTMEST